ncbi:helix-turn-helix transcriptional regulator [Thalassotalea marina]|uniref:DNA-binding transcriptional regulator n=1 Tax=Thalassotalea marina TaxID=1673741 RepID=A0A919BHF7_9GAMM|nr:YafY family protein [Thalassotalea marina]GHF89235.1 DNA-binding transcriptional regulator [Thalassotalea marina]
MRKAERLFQLVTLLRGRRLAITAKQLSETLEVSERTIYRDIQALMLSGVPIEGEAGIGYRLDRHFELPPLMFTSEELLALILGSKMVKTWGDSVAARGAVSALDKITAILPERLKQQDQSELLLVPEFLQNKNLAQLASDLRAAVESCLTINIEYQDEQKRFSSRNIEPLGLVYWGGKWTLIAFCLLRQDYREFRIDRIVSLTCLDIQFEKLETKSLKHYLSQFACHS